MKNFFLLTCLFYLISFSGKAQIPTHVYNFSGNLLETGGGTALLDAYGAGSYVTDSYCGSSKTVYQFAAGQGLQLNEALTGDYTIEMFVKLSNVTSYNRLVDFKNLATDCGIYAVSSSTAFYCITGAGSAVLSAGTWAHLFFTRNSATNQIQGFYANPADNTVTSLYSAADAGGQGITDANNRVVFFRDNGGEHYAGSVSFIRLYNSVLSNAEITARSQNVCPPLPPAPSTVYEYEFKGNFLEKNGLLPALTQLGTGNFGNYSLCGTTRPAYNFDYNSGFYFDNNAAAPGGFITNTSGQTIELYMKFQNVSTWRRIIDYKNRTSDRGVYAYGLAFQFYNFVTGGTSIFNANAWVYVAVTRSAAKVYNLYLAGTTTPLATFNDTGDDGIPNASGRISFFQDDLAVGGEASAGSIALLRIHNRELSGVEIRDNANDTCSFILSPDWLAFFAKRKNQNVQLDWTVNWGEEGGVFEIIRSENGKDFLTVGYVDSQKMQNTYSFEDKNAPQTDLYYQVRLRKQGTEIFATRAVFLPLHAESEIDLKVSPNPVSGQSSLQIDFNHSEKEITAWELADLAGQILQRGEFAAERGANRFYIDAPKVSGCFFLSLKTSVGIFRKKIISERK